MSDSKVTWIQHEERPGYFKDVNGQWQPDRRQTPDRRDRALPVAQHYASRRTIRRAVDREIIKFLATG